MPAASARLPWSQVVKRVAHGPLRGLVLRGTVFLGLVSGVACHPSVRSMGGPEFVGSLAVGIPVGVILGLGVWHDVTTVANSWSRDTSSSTHPNPAAPESTMPPVTATGPGSSTPPQLWDVEEQ